MLWIAGIMGFDGKSLELEWMGEPKVDGREELDPSARGGGASELNVDELRVVWEEAVNFARLEIGRFACWRGQDEPVLADGYDAEGVTQAAFERLLSRGAGEVPIIYSLEEMGREVRRLIKHRVRLLHERSERRMTVSEWDVLPANANGEPASIFEYLRGRSGAPDEELMEKERQELLGEFKAGFEVKLWGELLEVFKRSWDGQRRREIAKGLGVKAGRAKALLAQLSRRLMKAKIKDGGMSTFA